ncbi:MAG: MG2 domain-containing protein, partial [FCB group bacterium]
MKVYLRILLAITFIFLMLSCGNSVKVVKFSPEGQVNTLTTFTIEFSKELAPADMQDKWLTDEFISFEPKIQGKFKWVSGNTLIFSPDVKLEPIQEYQAEITKKVLFNTPFSLDTKTIKFHTPDFNISKVDLFWTQIPNQYYKMSVQANLQFNYPVVPEQLRQFIEVQRDGNIVNDYQIVTKSKSDMIGISLGEIQQTDKEQNIKILVKKGLESVYGKKPLQDDKNFDLKLPPITQLTISGVASGFDGNTGWIEVGTTQMVDEKKLKDYVTTEPGKKLNFFVSENLFRIETDFENMQTVILKIKKGLPGMYGGILQDDFEQEVTFANLNPSINFVDKKGKYLMLGGQQNLQVNSVNIDEAEVEVSKVYKNNILFFLNQYSYDYGYEGDYGWNPEYYVGDYGRVLYSEKFNLKNSQNWLEKFTVNLNKILNPPKNLTPTHSKGEGEKAEEKWDNLKGIYVVNVHSAQDRWISDSKIVAMTDLAIIAKKSGNELLVFVNSIASAEPVSDVDINIISSNNQTLLTGKTDVKGIIKFDDIEKKTEGFTPRLIVAEKENDFNYLDFKETFIETSRFDVGGMYEMSDNYLAFIYGDRNIYRPGETVYLSGIIRNESIKKVDDMPVIIKIITPTGKVLDEYKKNLNDESSFELSFKVPEYVQTGDYVAEVQTGTNVLIASYKFSVEDFVPDKIRLILKSAQNSVSPGENVKVNIDAEFLFGAKASDLKYEAHINLKHKQFMSKNYSDFEFNNSSVTNGRLPEYNTDGFLDKDGKAEVNYQVPADLKSSGVIAGFAYINVFDLTGRTVNRIASFDVYPKSYFIGIKSPGYYFGTNDRINFKIVAVNPDDKAIGNFTGTAKLIRLEWQTVLKKDNSDRYYYASEEKEILEWEKNIDISGGTKNLSFNVSKSGKYSLRISKKGEDEYQSKTFYAYGWESSTASSFKVDREGRIDIVLDKKVYQPGEKAKVLFTCPFSGKMLVTIERNGVYDEQYVDVENKSAEIYLPVYDNYMPNVYISATLFKKHTIDNTTPFLVGHGYAAIKVEKKQNKLPVTISTPKKIKPNTTQYITVKAGSDRDIYVTLAAVDEGILQVKNYETPDPYAYMYAKRALNVESYDLYKLLLPEIVKGNSLTGGGDDKRFLAQLKKRTNPIPSKRYTLFAFWSGIVKTNSSGQVTIPVNVPQFNGEIRLMAVAYTESKFGSAEEHIKCADDLIIEPEVPRFLSINDSLVMPVTVINTTSNKGNVKLNVRVEGVLRLVSAQSATGTIEPNSTKQFIFAVKSDNNTGQGKIVFETSGIAKVKEEINVGVRPVSPLVTETGAGVIRNGQYVKLNIPNNYLQGTQFTNVTISKFPAIKFAKELKYLIGYPYGCIEQTVSRCFPQIYFVDLGPLIAPEIFKNTNSVYFVKEGIRKVESMQL